MDRVPVFSRLREEFDAHSVGIKIIEKNLNVEKVLLALFLNGRRAESQRRPVFREFSLPCDEIGSDEPPLSARSRNASAAEI